MRTACAAVHEYFFDCHNAVTFRDRRFQRAIAVIVVAAVVITGKVWRGSAQSLRGSEGTNPALAYVPWAHGDL